MQWSKLKQKMEENFAPSVQGRVHIFATRYTTGSYYMVRAWLTLDKVEIVNFSTPDNGNRFGWDTPAIHERIAPEERHTDQAAEKGEFSREDFFDACWEYTNTSIEAAHESQNPIIQAFAMLDRRTGKRRLQKVVPETLHPLPLRLWQLRCECEGLGGK